MRVGAGLAFLLMAALLRAQDAPPPPPPHGPGHGDVIFFPGGPGEMGVRPAPLGDWWKNSEVIQQLQLSDQQRQQLGQAFVQHRLRLIDEQAALAKEELKLQSLMDLDQPPEGQVMAQVDQVQAARGALEKEFTAMTLDFRRIVTPEQWRKLQSIREGQRKMFIRAVPPPPGRGKPPGE